MFLVFYSLHKDSWSDAKGGSQMVRGQGEGSKRQASALQSIWCKVMSEI